MALQAELKNEIATIEKDITQPVFGGVLRHQDDTLLTRGQGKGLKIYDEIERDCHAFAVLQKRKMAVIARELIIDPASNSRLDRKAADMVKAQLAALATEIPDDEILPQATGFDATCLNLLDAVLKGYAVGEIMWTTDGKEIVAGEVRPKDQRRFAFTKGRQGYRLNLLDWNNMIEGTPVPPRKFVVNSFGSKNGSPYGLGLGSRLFWPVFFKRQDITFWLTFVDKFASPTVLGKYPTGTEKPDQDKLLAATQAIAHDTGVVIPQGMLVELLEAQRSGATDAYEKLARYMDEQMSETVLGETGSTNQSGGGGSRARDQVGNEIRLELVKADSDLLSGTINGTLVRWIVALNLPGANPPRVWRDCQEPEDLKARADRDKVIVDMGFKPSLTYIQETYGGEWTETAPPSKPATAPEFAACPSCNSASFAAEQQADPAVEIAGQALGETDDSALVAVLQRHIAAAGSLKAAAKGLDELLTDDELQPLADTLGRAMVLAQLVGRDEIEAGAVEGAEFAAEYGGLPFDEAIAFFRQKLSIPTARWTDLWKGEHARGFTIAGALREELLEDFRAAIDSALADGTSYAAFLKDFDRIVSTYGWSYNGGRGWRSRVIYQTNIRTAYAAGRWAQMNDPDVLKYRPYRLYRHGDSVKPRQQHLAWDGLVLPADDPWWDTHYTPNGWGCTCKVFALSERDLQRLGKDKPDQAPDDGTYEWVDKQTGELHQIPNGIDPGWDYNVGKQWFNPQTQKREDR